MRAPLGLTVAGLLSLFPSGAAGQSVRLEPQAPIQSAVMCASRATQILLSTDQPITLAADAASVSGAGVPFDPVLRLDAGRLEATRQSLTVLAATGSMTRGVIVGERDVVIVLRSLTGDSTHAAVVPWTRLALRAGPPAVCLALPPIAWSLLLDPRPESDEPFVRDVRALLGRAGVDLTADAQSTGLPTGALTSYQKSRRLPVTGSLDAATGRELVIDLVRLEKISPTVIAAPPPLAPTVPRTRTIDPCAPMFSAGELVDDQMGLAAAGQPFRETEAYIVAATPTTLGISRDIGSLAEPVFLRSEFTLRDGASVTDESGGRLDVSAIPAAACWRVRIWGTSPVIDRLEVSRRFDPGDSARRLTVTVDPTLTQPKLVQRVEAVYSEAARRDRLQGIVRLAIVVGRDGRVQAIQVVGKPHALLAQAAVQAARQWRFEPATKAGVAAGFAVVTEFTFQVR